MAIQILVYYRETVNVKGIICVVGSHLEFLKFKSNSLH